LEAKPLFLHDFFRQLETQLRYQPGVGKYKLLLQALQEGVALADDAQHSELLALCKTLFLENHRDTARFEQLFHDSIEEEKRRIQERLSPTRRSAADNTMQFQSQSSIIKKSPKFELPKLKDLPSARGTEAESTPSQRTTELPVALNFDTAAPLEKARKLRTEFGKRFLFSNDYQPISERDLAQSWRRLRFREKAGDSEQIDVEATIQKIAEYGFFTDAVYHPDFKNKSGALLILADCQGSMLPFHSLTEQIIEVARKTGGHPNAKVFYFRNVLRQHVYREVALLKAVKLHQLINDLQQERSSVFIISDAGAARGRQHPERIQATWEFLETIRRTNASVSWLNPMPRRRWTGTSAMFIAHKVPMFPVLESGRLSFDRAVKNLVGGMIR